MKWVQIAGADLTLAEKQPEYDTIKVRRDVTYVQHGSLLVPQDCLTAEIKPEAEDLERLLSGGSLFLRMLGRSWPPALLMSIDPRIADEAAGSA